MIILEVQGECSSQGSLDCYRVSFVSLSVALEQFYDLVYQCFVWKALEDIDSITESFLVHCKSPSVMCVVSPREHLAAVQHIFVDTVPSDSQHYLPSSRSHYLVHKLLLLNHQAYMLDNPTLGYIFYTVMNY